MSLRARSNRTHWEWPEARAYVTATGGFPPSLFARTLSTTLPIQPGKTRLLDIGCGCGIVGIYCLIEKKALSVTFTDVQSKMIATSRANVETLISKGLIFRSQIAYQNASFVHLPANLVAQHSLAAFNPPQLPCDYVNPTFLRKAQANASTKYFRIGGPDGLDVVREFLGWYAGLKNPKPDAVLLLSSFLGRSRIEHSIATHGLALTILTQSRVPLRPILTEAADTFSSIELNDRSLERDSAGNWTKHLLTIALRDI